MMGKGVTAVSGIHPRPLFPLATALMVGMVLGERYPCRLGPWCVAGGYLLALALVGFRRCRTAPVTACLFVFLGTQLIAPWAAPRFDRNHISHWIDAGPVLVFGKVGAVLPRARFGSRFVLDCEQIRAGPSMLPVTGRLRIFARGTAPEMVRGDRVEAEAVIRPVRTYGNPGGFDYNRYLAMQGIWALGKARGGEIRVAPGGGGPFLAGPSAEIQTKDCRPDRTGCGKRSFGWTHEGPGGGRPQRHRRRATRCF